MICSPLISGRFRDPYVVTVALSALEMLLKSTEQVKMSQVQAEALARLLLGFVERMVTTQLSARSYSYGQPRKGSLARLCELSFSSKAHKRCD